MSIKTLPQAQEAHAVAHYKAQEGLKKIASAEAAERYFARAKDAAKLYEAVELKLTEQRKFVLWWDRDGLRKGGKPSRTDDGLVLARFGVDGDTVLRWRRRLKDDAQFDTALEAAKERCRRVCEADKGSTDQKGASGTGENEWYTPAEYIEAARDVLEVIDLDPASSEQAQATVKAERYFTAADDGLRQEWSGRVWLNPPYAQPLMTEFIKKLVGEVIAERVTQAIVLAHNYTDTEWFHILASRAQAICFTRGRIRFIDAKGQLAAPTQGQAFSYFQSKLHIPKQTFIERFRSIGFIVVPA